MSRIWDRFLTESDRDWVQARAKQPVGFGERPALLCIDLYRGGLGDVAAPLAESMRQWPWSCGLAGWQALPRIAELLATVRGLGLPVMHSTMREGGDGLLGWMEALHGAAGGLAMDADKARRAKQIVDEAAPLPGEALIAKAGPSAFWGTPLMGHLVQQKIDTLIVAGMATSGCVRASVVEAASYRLKVVVVEDCVFDRVEASHAMNLFDIDQKYGDVISLQSCKAELAARYAPSARSGHGSGIRTSIVPG